ncbi:MAG: ATP-binding cassette domain-containing protein [Actinomycetaceae bacterium]|nr:ATP-binding cassette domain-containing protein [Actinomycetaceae bacterium]MDU0970999.1 ATP-binding cassette domain-containing protein [Actinomycetaceae bacterium]
MIEATNLTKVYGSRRVLDAVSLEVPGGCVTGFVGPNGAGKSTTMRLIAGLEAADEGDALIDGHPMDQQTRPLSALGCLLDAQWFLPARSGRDHLRALAAPQGIPTERIDYLLRLVELEDAAKHPVKTYSLGMRQRLGIAAAFLGDAHNYLLDEPANGLDPQGIAWLRRLLRAEADRGKAILLSSHLMAEMAQIADRVVVISQGVITDQQTLSDFVATANEVVVVGSPDPRLTSVITAIPGAHIVQATGDELRVDGVDAATVGRATLAAGVALTTLTTLTLTLEEAYLARLAGNPGAAVPAGPGTAAVPARPMQHEGVSAGQGTVRRAERGSRARHPEQAGRGEQAGRPKPDTPPDHVPRHDAEGALPVTPRTSADVSAARRHFADSERHPQTPGSGARGERPRHQRPAQARTDAEQGGRPRHPGALGPATPSEGASTSPYAPPAEVASRRPLTPPRRPDVTQGHLQAPPTPWDVPPRRPGAIPEPTDASWPSDSTTRVIPPISAEDATRPALAEQPATHADHPATPTASAAWTPRRRPAPMIRADVVAPEEPATFAPTPAGNTTPPAIFPAKSPASPRPDASVAPTPGVPDASQFVIPTQPIRSSGAPVPGTVSPAAPLAPTGFEAPTHAAYQGFFRPGPTTDPHEDDDPSAHSPRRDQS